MEDTQFLTSSELASRHGCSRDRMEALLDELKLRREGDDGGTLYDVGEVERRLAERDKRVMSAAVEALDFVEDVALATEILHQAFYELKLDWLQRHVASGDVLDILKRQLTSHLPKLVVAQRAQSGTGGPTVPEILRDFERTIVAALHERRQQPSPGQPQPADASKEEA